MTTARQRAAKCATSWDRSISLEDGRTAEITVIERRTRSSKPCAISQSSVVEAELPPSTLGVETTISWSAIVSTPRMAE